MKKLLFLLLVLLLLISCNNIIPIPNIDQYSNPGINYFETDLTSIGSRNINIDGDFEILLISDTHFGKTKSGTVFKIAEFADYIQNNGILDNIDLVINLGDVSDNSEQAQFDSYQNWSTNLFSVVPIINVIGNHDNRNGGVERFINTVAGTASTFYCFKASDIHFYVVDSAYRTLGRQQLGYFIDALEKDSSSKKIVLTHIPLYGSITNFYASFADEKERNFLLSNLSKFGVDLLLTGHKHADESYYSYTQSFTEVVVHAFHGDAMRNSRPSFYTCTYKKNASLFTINSYSYNGSTFEKIGEHSYTLK